MPAARHTDRTSRLVKLADGRRVLIRTVGPADKDQLAATHAALSREAVYRRFLAPKPELSPRDLRYLTEVDGHSHVGLVAQAVGARELVGVIRFVRLADRSASAEWAVVVADDWQRVGLGRALMEALATAAGRAGVARLVATSHHDNHAVPALVRGVADPVDVRHVGGGIVAVEGRLRRAECDFGSGFVRAGRTGA